MIVNQKPSFVAAAEQRQLPSRQPSSSLHTSNKRGEHGTTSSMMMRILILGMALGLVLAQLGHSLEGMLSKEPTAPSFQTNSNSSQAAYPTMVEKDQALRELSLNVRSSSSMVCRWLNDQSPMRLWTDHLSQILDASQLPMDRNYKLKNVTAHVLGLITERLPRSIKTLPHQNLARVLTKFEQRYKYLLQSTEEENDKGPPPITITVLGGSVTQGCNCNTALPRLNWGKCAWPERLQNMLNKIFVPNLFVVRTLAVGGMNTKIGQSLLEYDLVDTHADILINAYSTNDMHILTMQEAMDAGMTIREKTMEMGQDFVRTALRCNSDMLLFWLDDYLGNEQRGIMQTQELAQSIHVLANYYGFGFVSYADMVRSLVYSDTHETMFSPAGWYSGPDSDKMKREIHPGQGMHTAVSFAFAYSFLNTVTTHCGVEQSEDSSFILQMARRSLGEGPKPPVKGLPPKLQTNLTLDFVSQKWWSDSESEQCPSLSDGTKRCPFSWLSGMPWRKNSDIENIFQPVVAKDQQKDWHVHDDSKKQNKLGWVPREGKIGEAVTFEFNAKDYAAGQLQTVTLFVMKSYGNKWEGSQATVTVDRLLSSSGSWVTALEAPYDISGLTDKKTSETYAEPVHLLSPVAEDVQFLRVTLTLTGGSTFKLMGIAVCQ